MYCKQSQRFKVAALLKVLKLRLQNFKRTPRAVGGYGLEIQVNPF